MNFSPLSLTLARRAAAALAIIVLAAFVIAVDQAGAASTGTLNVSVSGVPAKPKKAKRSITVRVIDLRSGALVQADASKRANVKLKLAPGAYVVAVRSIDFPGKAVEGTSGIAVVKAGRKTKKKLRAKPLKKAKKKASKKARVSADIPASYFAPASETADKIVAGVDPAIRIRGLDGYPDGLSIDSVLLTPLTKGCPNDNPKLRFVEIARRAELKQEIDHGDDPRFDQATKIKKGRWWKERQMVRGTGIAENGRLTVQLSFVDLATGEVLSSSIAEGAVADFIDVIDAAANSLLEKICGSKVDVTFTGSGSYKRDEVSSDGDNEDHVSANYNWSITYRNVSLSLDDGTMTFASVSQMEGSWTTDGRFGVAGPGSYHCSAPLKSYSGEFATTTLARFGGNAKLTINPYFHAQGDIGNTTCSGLPGPPYASFTTWGHAPANQAVVEFPVADLSAGPLTFTVAPTTILAPDCSDLVGGYESPCTQTSTWSGKVTVSRAQP
ncbi:MAG: hypothetical protein JHC98_06130 [Thermoleophilaceae bacterium]|nr:hypothetical protein [Thermoleophilaceae bacterium]